MPINNNDNSIILSEHQIEDKVYVIRGMQVMLDFDLAEIYGYTTKTFNQQVKNNIEKFPDDFRFQLTADEVHELSLRSKNLTLNVSDNRRGLHSKYAPYAFTEQGIYMLMTVLRGDLATKQSIALIRLFKKMKEHLSEDQYLFGANLKLLTAQTEANTAEIERIKTSMVKHEDLTEFMRLFDKGIQNEEILIHKGEYFKADIAYQKIYRKAKKSIIVIDDYINPKTLQHLAKAKKSVAITIISDNKGMGLRQNEYVDFLKEYPGREVSFIKSDKRVHDRYIIIDNGTKEMIIYHCGASSKDAGNRTTSIAKLQDTKEYRNMIKELLANPELKLK